MSDTTETQEAPAFDGSIEQAVGLITMPEESEQVEQEEITESEDVSPEMEASESEDVDDAEVNDGEEEETEVEMSDDDEEADEPADPEEPAPTLFTVKVDGEEQQVSLEDLKQGYSGQKYVQKGMQEAAAIRKQAEEAYTVLQAESQKLVELNNQLRSGKYLTPPQPPTKKLFDENPLGYLEADAEYKEKLQAYQIQQSQINEQLQLNEQAQTRARQAKLELEAKKLVELVPEFADQKVADTLKSKMVDIGHSTYGYSYEELNRIDDSRAIAVLNDAIKYRQIVAGKSKAEQKAKGAKPVIKPGAKKNVNPSRKAMERQRAKFKKSGRIEDVLGLIVNE